MEAVLSVSIVVALLAFAIWRGRDVRFGASCLGARAYLEVKGTDRGRSGPGEDADMKRPSGGDG